MDLFGTKCTIALGTWKLRFVLMLEDDTETTLKRAPAEHAHHVTILHDRQNAAKG
ncbi:MAG: hypothetical protein M3R35_06610 [Candidatus Eremiobacteraeota bacterium]|nr:hypothetical protein [Candidatus Eremiobacteraeota bacterium]